MRKMLALAPFIFAAILAASTHANVAVASDMRCHFVDNGPETCAQTVEARCARHACVVQFKQAFVGPMLINRATCNFYINANNVSLTGVALGGTSSDGTFEYFQYLSPVEALLFSPDVTQYQFNAATLLVIEAADTPTIRITYDVSATGRASCSITGSFPSDAG